MIVAMQEPSAAGVQQAVVPLADSKDPAGDHVASLPPNPHALHYPPASYGHMMPPAPHMMLEHQFAQFGLHDSNNGSEHTANSSSHQATDSDNNDTENGGTNEGEEYDGEPVKLFVGQVPKSLNEEDIFPTFDSFGPLKDVAIIRDKHTGIHRGCAFVTFWNAPDAESAREALHDKFTFPGGKRPAQVKPAEPSTDPDNKLFIGMLSRGTDEEELRELFSTYGEIKEIYMIRNQDGSSKCAAFLRFVSRSSAVKAIAELNGSDIMEDTQRSLIVKFADNKYQRQQRFIRKQGMMGMPGPTPYAYPHHPQVHHQPHPGAAQAMGIPMHGPQFQIPHGYPGPPHYAGAQGHPYMYPAPFGHPYPYPRPESQPSNNPRPREGPAGANLFVYHLPHDLTDADLATAFNPFGNVISAKVYVDKFTGESKGFGFVSYDSVTAAESAIEQMNGFQIGNKRLKVQHKRVHHGSTHEAPQMQQHVAVPPPSG